MKRSAVVVVSILCVTLLTQIALADDLNPPPWRGQSGTTFQEWLFSTNNPTPAPDLVNNPYGLPALHAYPGQGQSWVDLYAGRQGMWPLSGTMIIDIPNSQVPNPFKDIWIQITWAKQVSTSTPDPWETISGIHATKINEIALDSTWKHSTYAIHIEPNPAFEQIKIDGTIIVDQLVIDTVCAPEPATMAMLGLGGLLLARRKK